MRICIIGAGASGVSACKACLEMNFDVVVYEQTNDIGGLLRYRYYDDLNVSSVAKSTVILTSKEMTAFSDFPPPDHFPNYLHNSKIV